MANSSPKKLVQMLNLDSIFEEATTTATAEIDSRRRFEQLRLLDGLRDFVSGNVTLGDLLMTLEILEEKFSVSSDKIAAARRDYLFEYIFERVRSSGYQCEINPAFLKRINISEQQASSALLLLSEKGYMVAIAKDEYRATPKVWEQDIRDFHDKVLRIDSELGQLIREKSRDTRKIGWDYLKLLAKILPIIDSLIAFNQPDVAELVKKRISIENSHFRKHHAGRWTQEMIGKFRTDFRSYFERLPAEIRIQRWVT